MSNKPQNINKLFSEIKQLIEEARQTVAVAVNAATTILYWNIGRRIKNEILENKRAEYGEEVVKTLSQELTREYGKGWSEQHIWHCLRFAETFPDNEILYALSRQLSWTHFRKVMYLNDELKREFYIQMTRIENWNTRTLNEKIDSMLFERTAISKKPEDSEEFHFFGSISVGLKPKINLNRFYNLLRQNDLEIGQESRHLSGWYVLEPLKPGIDVVSVANRLFETGLFNFSSPSRSRQYHTY